MQKLFITCITLSCLCAILFATTNNEKSRLKPKTGNMVVVFRDDGEGDEGIGTPKPHTAATTLPWDFADNNNNGNNSQPQSNERGRSTQQTNNSWFGQWEQGSGAGMPTLSISAYPNPCTDRLNIDLPSNDNALIALFNLAGQKVGNIETNGQSRVEIDVSQFNAGMYLIAVQNQYQRLTQKINIVR